MDREIIVLCCHRSGSSMIAAMLHGLGVDMGAGHLMPPSSANPLGYFEDTRFVNLNERILRSVGGSWNVNVTPDDLRCVRERFSGEMWDLVRPRAWLWGWKDPRTALTISLWEPCLVNPSYVVVLRDPRAIAQSLQKRDKFSESDGLKLAAMYYYRIWQFVRQCKHPVLQIKYEDVLANPLEAAQCLKNFTGAPGDLPVDIPRKSMNHYAA